MHCVRKYTKLLFQLCSSARIRGQTSKTHARIRGADSVLPYSPITTVKLSVPLTVPIG